jgi:NAD(P)H-hydrate repair Nnr-like enzyme with NAD(P)H-hydrate dehydratase domain
MADLLERDRSAIEDDPLAAAAEASETFGATVVMKGASTHVVAPGAPPLLYAGGGPGLGTSGSGDVLAGLITGFLARGAPPTQAAGWGVFVHGEAGARLAGRLGPVGFLAREISAEAPAILAAF